jgi:hypothetical protein
MRIDIDFFKSIYNDDIIYHYTKASTAIDFILYDNTLKFNESHNSIDPIESKKAHRSISYRRNTHEDPPKAEVSKNGQHLLRYASSLEKSFYQISFCRNTMGSDFASEFYICGFRGHEELFGFTKPRMWNQYADNYTGVCLAFAKSKILSLNQSRLKLIEDNVQYLTFRDLLLKKLGNIDGDYLERIGLKNYKKQVRKIIKQSFFVKHIDYAGENEYRIGTLYKRRKSDIEIIRGDVTSGKTILLDVTNCLIAIFISSFTNEKQKQELRKYANELCIPIIEMKWKNDSFDPLDYNQECISDDRIIKILQKLTNSNV